MRSTMQDVPLSVTRILAHGAGTHARSTVTTWEPNGASRRRTFAEMGRDAARLAHALRTLGVTGDQRVATFMFNNAEHMTAYLAVPAMGAVLHTLNIRLAPADVAWIANHAQDDVVIVDASLAPAFAAVLPPRSTVPQSRCTTTRRWSRRATTRSTGRSSTSATRPRSATPRARPAGRAV